MKKFLRNSFSVIYTIMKYSMTVLAIVCALSGVLLANSGKAQQLEKIRISLSTHQHRIQDVLAEIESKTKLKFVYNPEELSTDKIEDKLFKDESVKTVLQKLGYSCRQEGSFLIVTKLPKTQQPGRISGKVTDDRGETLPGASVKVLETNIGVQTSVDGSYTLSLSPGKYTVEVSFISYQRARITEVLVTTGKSTSLNIALKPDTRGLKEVTVTSNYKKASTEGLLTRQKNAAEMSNGISADQISKTPDANLGEAIKRITGVSTVDNKYVVVRGMGERYNSATLDGIVLPSTETSKRAFAFDLIPANLIDNVTISKTITPDMNASFGGGLIQINTKDIPDVNFTSFAIGTGFNTISTGKDMYGPKRGKYDYFGFDDGRRDFPKNFKRTEGEERFEQSKRFTKDNLSLYTAPAAPAQNYQFSLGRVISVDTGKTIGIVGALSYRNGQDITEISDFRRGGAMFKTDNYANTYTFNTTLGAILNMGIKFKNHRFSLRNTYTRKFESQTSIYQQYYETASDEKIATEPRDHRINIDPTFLDILQNKLGSQHQLNKVKVDWNVARTAIQRNQKDVVRREMYPEKIDGVYVLTDNATNSTQTGEFPMSRHHYLNQETDYNWDIAATFPLNFASTRNVLKAGYAGNQRHLKFGWESTELNHFSTGTNLTPDSLQGIPLAEKIKPENLNPNGYVWAVQPWGVDFYEGRSKQHAGFLMLDNRFSDQFRLVWGVRAEYYNYKELQNSANSPLLKDDKLNDVPDAKWRWMPSANFTYSPTQKLNLRTAFSRTMIRPEFLERARFAMFNPELGGRILNINGLTSTRIDAYDFKVELFPGLGETVSIGAFYRYIDKPVEMEKRPAQDGRSEYILDNSLWAKNYGLEFEFRKKLNFIADYAWLNNITLFGNATYNQSTVQRTYVFSRLQPDGKTVLDTGLKASKRPLYGQTPYMLNAGIQYEGKKLGLNIVYNKTGRKMYIVGSSIAYNEYQRPYSQLDAQISYKFLKPGLEIKFNAANLLDQKIEYYSNGNSYRQRTVEERVLGDDDFILKPGYSDNYEKDDFKTFSQRFGRSFSLQLNYNF